MLTGIKAVLFDMDGVLVDTEPVILAASIAGLAEYGIQANPEDFIPFIGTGEDRFIGGVAEKYGLIYKPEMKERVYRIYQEIVPFKLKVFDGVLELLSGLKEQGRTIVLASSADWIKIRANLKAAQIPEAVFTAIISGEDVANKKPAPDIYLKAAQSVGASPADCVVIEDALNGIKAAKAAGMKCVAVASSFSEDELKKEAPDNIIKNIGELGGLLEK